MYVRTYVIIMCFLPVAIRSLMFGSGFLMLVQRASAFTSYGIHCLAD